MSANRISARSQVEKLVRYFDENIHQIKHASFNEAQTRQQLIDPFFEAFGWDVRNQQHRAPYELEVVPEGRVRTWVNRESAGSYGIVEAAHSGEVREAAFTYISDDEYRVDARMASKKPDYRFRINGSTKFFVEAKRPSIDLQNNLDAIFQIKRYGFSARVPVSILTDFEEFRVFDCTRKPSYDKPKLGALKDFDLTYREYLDVFDMLFDTFSRDAVAAGSLERLQRKYLLQKKGEFSLDRSFLDDLSEWRIELAQDIAKHPQNRRILQSDTLNECVQRILDRIIFFRVCEDRNIEEPGTLLALLRLWQEHPALSLYEQFINLIENRRSLYNGLLFTDHESEALYIGDKILEKIFKNVNYPASPYQFEEIGVEILGSIYERFLGKTIRLTAKQVRVEEKPEVRKAGGVYYTPQYIVKYIVDHTVGNLLEGKTPKQIEKLAIIDISCGSGSFLLGAFQKLIDYHIAYYTKHPDEIKEKFGSRDAYQHASGKWILSARKKREILLNNLYGVDIDPQAVEVTQMSLYLRVLENENDATLNKPTMLALHEVLLPSLKQNIKCGNSLVGSDYKSQEEIFGGEELRKIKPFDWEEEFGVVMKRGGFDCIIGNPPYGMVGDEQGKEYFKDHYQTSEGRFDTFELFMEKGLRLLNKIGSLGFIVPSTLLTNLYARRLRKFIKEKYALQQIVNFGMDVFEVPTIHSCITIIDAQRSGKRSDNVLIRRQVESAEALDGPFDSSLARTSLGMNESDSWDIFLDENTFRMLSNLGNKTKLLGSICFIRQCIKTGNDELYVKSSDGILPKPWKKSLRGRSIERYHTSERNLFLKYGEWLARNWKNTSFYETPKIAVRETGNRIIATLDEEGRYFLSSLYSVYAIDPEESHSIKYLLAILNSKFATYYLKKIALDITKGAFTKFRTNQLARLPIRIIDFRNTDEKKIHDSIVKLVDRLIALNRQLEDVRFASQREPLERQSRLTDKKIDQLIFELYELSEADIARVQSAGENHS